MIHVEEPWIALMGTVFGGAGLKVVEAIVGRKKWKADAAFQLREELRKELTELREESDQLRDELDEWRTKYYSLVSSIASGDLKEALRKISESK
jgi:uncharacterized coiled-coil DUF342 family protein